AARLSLEVHRLEGISLDPARHRERRALEDDFHAVFAVQAVGEDLELERAHRAEDRVLLSLAPALEDLDRALLGELVHPLLELLALHRVLHPYAREVLGREARDSLVADRLAGAERVADAKPAGVEEADHVARKRFFDQRPL